jgi:predicted dehydrogenase
MKEVRYGVVGAGWISQIAFMPAVAQTENSELTAIISGNADNASRLAEFHGVHHIYDYDRFDEMLADDIVDAVYIALPNSMHADYAVRAAKAGKHALVEKPLAITVEQCEAMISAAKEAGTWLMTAYRLHNDPGTIELLEQIRKGAIGDPRFFTSVFSFQSPPENHRLRAEHWGGPLQDIGVYCLNAARHVFGAEPVEAIATKGHGNGDPRFTEVEETIAVTLRFPGERFAQFIASFGADAIDMYRVIGTKGELTLNPGFSFETDTKLRLRQGGVTIFEKASPSIDHFGAQTAYFSDCILGGKRPESDGEEGLADVRAMRAIERAAETGKPQRIDSPPRTTHPSPDMVRLIPRTERRLVF